MIYACYVGVSPCIHLCHLATSLKIFLYYKLATYLSTGDLAGLQNALLGPPYCMGDK